MQVLEDLKEKVSKKETKLLKKLSPLQRRLYLSLTFLIIFLIFSASLHFLVWLKWDVLPFQKLIASTVSQILAFFGLKAHSSGIYIMIQELGTIKIVRDCLGWKSILALSGLVVSTRGISAMKKASYIVYGLLIVQAANLIRLVSTFYFVAVYDISFEIVHTFLWRWGLTFLILLTWIFWLKRNDILKF